MLLRTISAISTGVSSCGKAARQTLPPRLTMRTASLTALGAPEHIVDPLAAVEPAHRRDRVLPPDVDDVVGTEFAADLEPVVARTGEDDGMRAERSCDRDAEEADRGGAGAHQAF